jgi:hypothetical protein
MPVPERPPSVPLDAVFNAEASLWEAGGRNAEGAPHGAFSTFRADGELLTRGSYVDGKPDGTLSRFTSGAPGSLPLRACCVPPGARELRARYQAGRFLDEHFCDERGRPLSLDGTPWPDRDERVPEDASYDPGSSRFVARREGPEGLVTLSYFKLEGWLEEELDSQGGYVTACRRFGLSGALLEETGLDQQNHRHGAYRVRSGPSASPLVDTRVREVAGQYEHGEEVGTWELRDETGAVLGRVAFGRELADDARSLVAGTEPAGDVTAEALWQLADERGDRAPREAFALAARAFAKGGDSTRFEAFLARRTIRLRPEVASERARLAAGAERLSASSLLGAALGGASPALILRHLALALRGHAPAALDYFDASLRLDPEQDQATLARGLLCIEQGEPEGALAAAAVVAGQSEAAGALLRDFCRISYGGFVFRPALDGVATPEEELVELQPAQTLAAIRRTIGLYATRVGLARAELRRRAGSEQAWLPPDTSELLPDGAVELRHFTARIEDEGDEGPEISEVEIDERVTLEQSTRELMLTARSDWAALGWLCWSVGLDHVALPETVDPRPNLSAAIHQAILRCWRAHDRVRTRGLIAMARKAPSFVWEGMAIDDVPAHLAELVAAEYLGVRAQFMWQLFEQNPSPFQADLRRV